MNLFYDPSIAGLRQLVDTADKSLPIHNIVIDFDGEVIIDPEKKYEGIDLERFKFRTRVTDSVKTNGAKLRSLYQTLVQNYSGTAA